MPRTALVTCGLTLLPIAVPVQAEMLEYRVTGIASYYSGPDTALDGASFEFVARIHTNTEPFYDIPGFISSYYFLPGTAQLTIAGSPASDGTCQAASPYALTVVDGDFFFYDEFTISAANVEDGVPFDFPGTASHSFRVDLHDAFAASFTDTTIPDSLDAATFTSNNSSFAMLEDSGILATTYYIDDYVIEVAAVPEPTCLALLVAGVAMLPARRCFRP